MPRSCGSCTACCTLLSIPELQKPEATKCSHQCQWGCGIYGERPESCRVFECLWLQGALGRKYKPDECGLMVSMMYKTKWGDLPAIYETRKDAVLGPLGVALLAKFAREKVRCVVIHHDGTRSIMLPHGSESLNDSGPTSDPVTG